MENYNILTKDNIKHWFKSETIADNQLNSFKENSSFIKKYPNYKTISNILFECDSIYDNFKFSEFKKINLNFVPGNRNNNPIWYFKKEL